MAELTDDGWISGGPLAVTRLTVEYAERPLGTDVARPRLAWIVTAVPAPYAGEADHQDGYSLYTVGSGHWSFTSRTCRDTSP